MPASLDEVLPADVSGDPALRERFNREADLAAKLWHPHIVGVHDRVHEGQLWIAMDFVDGTDSQYLLVDHYPAGMPADEVATIMTAVAGALAYDHRGLLHRDVKPANIMLAGLDQLRYRTQHRRHQWTYYHQHDRRRPSFEHGRVCGDRGLGGGVRRLLLPFLRWSRGDLGGAGDERDDV